jgi:hypothetical protein
MATENDMEWFTPGKSCKKCDTKPFSGFIFELLHFYESVFPLIRELAKNYILTSKGRHHFSVFSKEK